MAAPLINGIPDRLLPLQRLSDLGEKHELSVCLLANKILILDRGRAYQAFTTASFIRVDWPWFTWAVLALATLFLVLGAGRTAWITMVTRVSFFSLALPIGSLLLVEAPLTVIGAQELEVQLELWRQVQFLVTQLSLDVFGLGSLTIAIGSVLYFIFADPRDKSRNLNDQLIPAFLVAALVAVIVTLVRIFPWF